MDDLREIQSVLGPEEKCNVCIRGKIVRNLETDERLLAVVKKQGTAALLVYSYLGDTILAENLKLEYALPINKKFSVALGNDISVCIVASKGIRVVVETTSDEHVSMFIMELKKAINAYKQRVSVLGESTFQWLENFTTDFKPKPRDYNIESTDGPSFRSHLISFNNPSVDTTKSKDSQEEDSVAMLQVSSLDLSSNEVVLRSRLERSSLSHDTPMNFRTERDTFVRLLLGDREAEFVNIKQLRFLVCTWNVNGQEPGDELRPWFTTDEGAPDVIAIGFQELDLSAEAFMGRDSKREVEWIEKVRESIDKVGQYEMVQSVRLVGMLLIVFIKNQLYNYVIDVDTRNVGTGIMGMMGNKGGVAVRFQLFNTSVCFVNSHLAAHQDEVARRNQDYRDIMARLTFPQHSLTITDHDVVFWFGDLNYRIDLPNDVVRKGIDSEEFEGLARHDQLIVQMHEEKCFQQFKEGWLQFQPTYKYNPGTDEWDSEKDRVPAWCDRVLWWTSGNNSVQQMAYTSCPQLKLSDHKPVHALFNVNVKVVDKVREKGILEEIVRELDKRENDFLPQIELSVKELLFGDVQFLEKKTLTFELSNIGQVAVQYTFIPKLQEKHFCKPWVIIEPCAGLVKQNAKKEVKVSVFVDKDSAGPLTDGKEKMEDILVLHLQGGKDFFIPISGTYISSVFGSSIERLVFLYQPIQEVPVAQLIDFNGSQVDSVPNRLKALDLPKELWLLVDHLQKHGLKEPSIFRMSAFEGELQLIRDHLDRKADGNLPGSIHSVAEALLLFIESLQEPVIPFFMYKRCVECSNNYTLCKQMVINLKQSHKNVFTYLIEFLKELLYYSHWNGLDAKVLAMIFGAIMMRPPPDEEPLSGKQLSQHIQRRAKFIHHFIMLPSNHSDGNVRS